VDPPRNARCYDQDGNLWDRHGQCWTRTDAWLAPEEATAALDGDATWVVEFCQVNFRWPDDPDHDEALSVALGGLRTERQTRRALVRRNKKTVFIAERWRTAQGREMIVFAEGPPGPR
jgi:hypothetical protein